VSHAIFILTSVLWCNRQTVARHGDFEAQTKKPLR
jgi:hypothetical protein